jgi:hypothetical protein
MKKRHPRFKNPTPLSGRRFDIISPCKASTTQAGQHFFDLLPYRPQAKKSSKNATALNFDKSIITGTLCPSNKALKLS